MSYGILIDASQTDSGKPEWVAEYDPDAHPPGAEPGHYPTGNGACKLDPAEALRFDSAAEATECWRQVSTFTPERPDGRPNRPLTVFTVTIEQLPEATQPSD